MRSVGGHGECERQSSIMWLEGPDQSSHVYPDSGAPLGFSHPASNESGGRGLHWASHP